MARYSAVSTSNMSVRSDHTVYASKVYTQPANTPMAGDVLWIAPDAGDLVYAGDKWLQLLDGNWVAIVHLGVEYCILTDNGAPPADGDVLEIETTGVTVVKLNGSQIYP